MLPPDLGSGKSLRQSLFRCRHSRGRRHGNVANDTNHPFHRHSYHLAHGNTQNTLLLRSNLYGHAFLPDGFVRRTPFNPDKPHPADRAGARLLGSIIRMHGAVIELVSWRILFRGDPGRRPDEDHERCDDNTSHLSIKRDSTRNRTVNPDFWLLTGPLLADNFR
jgi:hypothetical protein